MKPQSELFQKILKANQENARWNTRVVATRVLDVHEHPIQVGVKSTGGVNEQ